MELVLIYYLLYFSVILSDYYDLPFNDILDWSKFSLILKERDVYQLKDILKSVSHDQFVALHNNLVEVLPLQKQWFVDFNSYVYLTGLLYHQFLCH